MVHKTCIGLSEDFEKTEKWFCDLCNELQKQVSTKPKETDLRQMSHVIPLQNLSPTNPHKRHQQTHNSNLEIHKTTPANFYRSNKIKKRGKNKSDKKKQKHEINLPSKAPSTEKESVEKKVDNKTGGNLEYYSAHLNDVTCYFCRLSFGPMMKLAKPENQWGHLSCSYWLPGVETYIPDRLIYISAKSIRKADLKGNEECAYCHLKEGLMVKCFQKECKSYFHVECARRVFCELKFPYQLKVKQKHHVVFCFEHSKTFDFRKIELNQSSDKTQMKNVLKNFSNHHNHTLHFDFKAALKKLKLKKIVVCLKKVAGRGLEHGYKYLETVFE